MATTKKGTPIEIYRTDGGGSHPIIGAWYDSYEGTWIPTAWTADGHIIDKDNPCSLDIDGL